MLGFMTTEEKAERLRALHRGPRALVLCNVWDAGSARWVESLGYPAIATTSGGIAFAHGRADGEQMPWSLMAAAAGEIARAVAVPVTADIESGYAPAPEEVAKNARAIYRAGVAGVNLEDRHPGAAQLEDLDLQREKLRAVRAACPRLVVNARTDAFWPACQTPDPAAAALRRGRAYLAAGADCIFVPFLQDREVIARLVREMGGPVNILAGPGAPPVPELEALGVRRVSVGSGPIRAALATLDRAARELRDHGGYAPLEGGISYPAANQQFAAPAH